MKLPLNLIRPLIFFFCGLGYLPLQSADISVERAPASVEESKTFEKEENSTVGEIAKNDARAKKIH